MVRELKDRTQTQANKITKLQEFNHKEHQNTTCKTMQENHTNTQNITHMQVIMKQMQRAATTQNESLHTRRGNVEKEVQRGTMATTTAATNNNTQTQQNTIDIKDNEFNFFC